MRSHLKFLGTILFALVFLVGGFLVSNTANATVPDVVISEFMSHPSSGSEWVELLNNTSSDIPLTGWKLTELTDPDAIQPLVPTEVELISLSGTLPANGILVFDVSGLNDPGDSIGLYNGATPVNRVTYGNVTNGSYMPNYLQTAPSIGSSGRMEDYSAPTTWNSGTPTKGWFNNAIAWTHEQLAGTGSPSVPPTLASIASDLSSGNRVVTNMGSIENPSAATNLYFEKRTDVNTPSTALGKIAFAGPLNLTDKNTVDYLKLTGNKLDIEGNGTAYAKIGLNTYVSGTTESVFKNLPATITMYGLSGLGGAPNLIVKNNSGNIIPLGDPNYPAIGAVCVGCGFNSGIFIFTTDHFTTFETEDTKNVVNQNTGTEYDTIQAAITAATPGDTINVSAGTYSEHLSINKSISLIGADKNTTIIDGSGTTGIVVAITAINVTFKNFTVRNSGTDITTDGGIGLVGGGSSITGITVENNIITNNATGVAVLGASNSTIRNNSITNNARYGIVLDVSPYNAALFSTTITISGNTMTTNARDGVYIGKDCNSNTITDNEISGATGTTESSNFEANGIYLWKSSNNTVTDNTVSGNTAFGIEMMGSSGNTITGNTLTTNKDGLHIRNSSQAGYSIMNNNISNNKIYSNSRVNLYTDANRDTNFKAENNWWGSADKTTIVSKLAGYGFDLASVTNTTPGTLEYIDYSPWCTNIDCTEFGPVMLTSEARKTGYETIVDAITAAISGDTINVSAGTYTEVGQIVIDKNISIIGADKATTIIKPAQDTGNSENSKGWFLVSSNALFNLQGVTLDGLTHKIFQAIRYVDSSSGSINNVKFINIKYEESGPAYNGAGIEVLTSGNVDVTDSQFSEMGRYGVQIYYTANAPTGTYSGNTYTGKGVGNWLDYAFEIGGGAHITLSDNTISDNTGVATIDGSTSSGISIWDDPNTQATLTNNTFNNNTAGVSVAIYNGETSDPSVTIGAGNVFNGGVNGIEVGGFEKIGSPVVSVSHSSFNGQTHFMNVDNGISQIDAKNNWWGTSVKADIVAKISGNVDFIPYYSSSSMNTLTISTPAISGVTTPANDATPVTTITETAQYTGTVTWSPADSHFLPSTSYTATITLTPKTGYSLTGVPADFFTVAGATATNVVDSGVVTAIFGATADQFTLTSSAGEHGSITPTASIDSGTSKIFTITPNTNYHIVDVLVDSHSEGAITSYTFTNVTAPHTISATFAINTYNITATSGTNGEVSPTGVITKDALSSQTYTITPNANYHVANVLVDGSSVGVITTYTFSSISSTHTISATFAINTYTLTYTAEAHGNIMGTSPQTVNYGGDGSTVTAVPNTGYHFTNWSDGILTAARTETNVTSNKSVTANFAINTYTLAYTAGDHGSITGTASQTVNHGASGTEVTAVANSGYHFVDWSDTNSTSATRTDTNVTANKSATANFALTPSNSKEITAFSFATLEAIGVVKESDYTIAINVPNGTNITALIPTITISGASVSPNTLVAHDFTDSVAHPIVYTVTAANSTTQNYSVSVTILPATQIAAAPTVTVNTTQKEVVVNSTVATTITIPENVPDATIDVSSLTSDDLTHTTATLPDITMNVTTSLSTTPVTVEIPTGTVVTAPTGWDGTINAPTVKENSTVTATPDSGMTSTVLSVIEVGYGDIKLTFDNAVRILIPGQAGKFAGYSRGGVFTEITNTCDADIGSTTINSGTLFPVEGDCKMDVGSDMVIWTKHFTTFATYTQTATNSHGASGSYMRPVVKTTPAIGQVLGAEKFNFTKFMKKGSKGNEIIELQKFLTTLGYTLTADGNFGVKTKAAVIKFQIANKLVGDGVIGAKTRAELNK